MSLTDKEIKRGIARLDKQFMTPNVWKGDVWEVSANHGETHYVPADVADPVSADAVLGLLRDYVEGTIDLGDDGLAIAERRSGVWFAQLSASGYMDQTDLAVFATEREALEYLVETYDDDDDDDGGEEDTEDTE